MSRSGTIQLGELCERLGVGARDARYVLEQGYIPKGVADSPDSGNYRQFGPGQAVWLGMVLKMKQFGMPTPLAAKIADFAQQALRGVTRNLAWDWGFVPMSGRLDTQHQYVLEIADLEHIRLGTDANPSAGGRLEYFDWHPIDKPGVPVEDLRPGVVVRLDLSVIAQSLAGAFGTPIRGG